MATICGLRKKKDQSRIKRVLCPPNCFDVKENEVIKRFFSYIILIEMKCTISLNDSLAKLKLIIWSITNFRSNLKAQGLGLFWDLLLSWSGGLLLLWSILHEFPNIRDAKLLKKINFQQQETTN